MTFEFLKQDIEDVILIKPKCYSDNRGFFMETYKKSEFNKNGILFEFYQDNHSLSHKGVLRGLHFQKPPYMQAKLVHCVKGTIIDIVVDIRPNSKTFKKYLKFELSEENKHILFVPEGFAHGFVVLSNEAELLYKASGEYAPEYDRGVLWNDREINVDWGIDFDPVLSPKDKKLPTLKNINTDELIYYRNQLDFSNTGIEQEVLK